MTLLFALFVCHWLADFTPLSTPWMLKAKRFGTPLWPIAAHAMMHVVLMSVVLQMARYTLVDAAPALALQFSSHWLIDIGKGRATKAFAPLQDISTKWFWVVLGFDQLLHTAVILLMARMIL